jgi:hypothetical protein
MSTEPNLAAPMFIDVLTCTRNPDEPPVQTHRINFHSDAARKWLIKHQWWSLHNGFTVHLATVEG